MLPEREYEALLESIADARPIDWAALDASAATSADRTRYRNLRLVARVAQLHRTLVLDEPEASVPVADLTAADPTTWGSLSILAPLASGAFGRIYRARDQQLNRDVALKLLRSDISLFGPVERLLSEARTLARIHHPNVVTVHGADVRDGRAGLWMELVDGQTLEVWARANGPMGAREAVSVGIDVCQALAAVHAADLVHGDVKAQNVMREKGGRIVLMDFGAGRVQGASAIGIAGTPMYLAPEVLAGEPPTPQSDLYSLGVLLFYLLTGQFPYTGVDLDGLRAAHADGDRRWLRDLRPELPRGLVQALERALESDPARRFVTAGEMERSLGDDRRHDTTPAMGRPTRRGLSSRAWFAATALVLVSAVVALIVWSRVVSLNRGTVLTGIRTVGVLPMVDSPDTNISEDFAGGLTEELISALGQVHALTIKPGTSLGPLAGKSDKDIAQSLDVDALLKTTIASNGGSNGNPATVKVRARLLAAGTQGIVWSHDFERPRGDSAALAAEIATALTRAVKVTLSADESNRIGDVHKTNAAAEEAYLAGRRYIEQYGGGRAEDARQAFERALQLDGDHARAHAGVARAYVNLGAFGATANAEARSKAVAEARHALVLDQNLVEAHTVLGHIYFAYDWDWPSAEREFKQSLELNSNSEYTRIEYANLLAALGRFDEALEQMATARQLDPKSGSAVRYQTMVLYYKRDYMAAEKTLQESATLETNQAGLPLWRARIAEARGDYEGALADTREALKLATAPAVGLRVAEVRTAALAGRQKEALALRAALLRELDADKIQISARDLAYMQLALGNNDRALQLLEEAVEAGDPTAVYFGVDPRVDPIRGTPRFRQLLKTIGLPAAFAEAH